VLTSAVSDNTALFARVKNVAENDTLNVHSEANHKSKKVGEIPPRWHIGVEKCKKVNISTWCKVYPLVQIWTDKFGANDTGWVNAKYLKFSNKGYVTVEGKMNDCYYAMECKQHTCHVVMEMQYDYEKNDMSLWKTEWIDRSKLKGESHFGAADSHGDGYCTNAGMIEDYLRQ
jgi:hypothetical protein